MATVFATFAADGVRHDPVFIKRVEDANGKVIFEADQTGVRAIDSQIARTVTDVLRGVITDGTGTRARLRDQVAAGKTGTTDNKSDAWFVGYTPNLVAAVWMGIPEEQVPMGRVGQFGSVYGGTYPALVWHNFMSFAVAGRPETPFIPPDESLWPYGRYVSEAGRGKTVYNNNRSTTRTTRPQVPFFGFPPPSSVPPAEPPPSTSPPSTTPTTAAPPGP
jgi:penicillin-binding protein 1A